MLAHPGELLNQEDKSSQNSGKDIGCSQSAMTKIWTEYEQNGKAVKGMHRGRPRKTSKYQDGKLTKAIITNLMVMMLELLFSSYEIFEGDCLKKTWKLPQSTDDTGLHIK